MKTQQVFITTTYCICCVLGLNTVKKGKLIKFCRLLWWIQNTARQEF